MEDNSFTAFLFHTEKPTLLSLVKEAGFDTTDWENYDKSSGPAMEKNNGRLLCEVPRCHFDFVAKYGQLGEGFAHVHHLVPLATLPDEGSAMKLEDLAVVCPNCHAMIHREGECRDMNKLIPEGSPHAL